MDLRSFARSLRLQVHSAVLALLASLYPAAPAWSQTAGPARAEPRFAIQFFAVEGVTLLPKGAIASALARFSGDGKRFADIESAVEALRALYEKAGITAVEVLIPEQELQSGVVKLQVREATVKKVEIVGAKQRSATNVRRAVPSLKEGTTPVDTVLAEEIRLSNESPSRQMQITFRAEGDESLTGVLRVGDRAAFGGQGTLDNTGNKATGRLRAGLALQHSNMLDRDVLGSLALQTSPGYEKEVRIVSSSLRVPIYSVGLIVDASAVHSSVDSGTLRTAAGDYLLSSVGNTASLRLTRLLPRWEGDWEPRVSLGWDWRQVDSRVTLVSGGDSIVPELVLRPLALGLAVSRRTDDGSVQAQIGISRNLPGGGRSAAAVFADPRLRAGANPRYTVWRANLIATRPALGGTLIGAWNAQWTRDALVSAEQFGIGGDGSIRGFDGRVASADQGQRLSIEWQATSRPVPLAPALQWAWQTYAEAGRVQRNLPLPGERVTTSLAAGGAGLRLSWRESTLMRADAGAVVRGDGLFKNGDAFVHLAVIHAF